MAYRVPPTDRFRIVLTRVEKEDLLVQEDLSQEACLWGEHGERKNRAYFEGMKAVLSISWYEEHKDPGLALSAYLTGYRLYIFRYRWFMGLASARPARF